MSDKIVKLENKVREGQLSRQLLNNPFLQQVLTRLKGDVYVKFEKSKSDQSDIRDELWRELQTIRRFEAILISALNESERAASMLDRLKNHAQKLKRNWSK